MLACMATISPSHTPSPEQEFLRVPAGRLNAARLEFGEGKGSLNFNHTDENHVFSSQISGPGQLNQIAGTTTLVGANSYTGGTTVSAGVLQGNASSLQGDIRNEATVVFDQATDGSYTGVMDGGGALHKEGEGTLALTGVNSYSGPTTVAAGRLVGSASSFGSGAIAIDKQATLEIAEASDATLTNDLTGNGALLKSGSGTLNYTGNGSAFTGTTQIIGGSLSVNGKLGGTLSLGQGARLQGTGTVGSIQLHTGAVLAPGNSIVTLKMSGDLTFEPGTYYEVEVQADGQSDLVQVTGQAKRWHGNGAGSPGQLEPPDQIHHSDG